MFSKLVLMVLLVVSTADAGRFKAMMKKAADEMGQQHWDATGHNWTRDCPSLATVKITLADLMNYSEECYNDSTHHDRATEGFNLWRWNLDGGVDSSHVELMGGTGGTTLGLSFTKLPRYYWEHREPTFQGFIEWLKGQLK